MKRRTEERLKTILYVFVSVAIIFFAFNKFCTYKVKNFVYRGISIEDMLNDLYGKLNDLYGKDFGIWKTGLDGMRVVTNYKTKDNRINLKFVGGFVDGVEFGDMKVNGMDLDGEKKTSYINGMNEEYRKKHNMPYGSTLTSTSEIYLGDQGSNQNSDKQEYEYNKSRKPIKETSKHAENVPYGSTLTSTSEIYLGDQGSNQNSDKQEYEYNKSRKPIKETSKHAENETFENNSKGYYKVNKNLPNGALSFLDEYVERLKNSSFPNTEYRFADVYQYEGEFSMGEEFENGYYVYISTNDKMGNYTFKIFCDAYDYTYYVESVKDKDNGKTYDTVRAINIYLDDVINRYENY